MSQYLDAASESIRKQEELLAKERPYHDGSTRPEQIEHRAALTEQWLKLAAISQGLNPWAPDTPEAGAR